MSRKDLKNHLKNKTCGNCRYRSHFDPDRCRYSRSKVPREKTCEHFEEGTPGKLNVKWTKEAELDLKEFNNIDVEEELIKAASEELSKL
jgi:hypothetical protein